jgi:hypothetical protein
MGQAMISFPIPMQAHVLWHPLDDAACRPIAEKIRTALTRDSYQPLVPGIGIPVFYRCASGPPGQSNDPPKPILMPDTLNDLRIALVTADFLEDPAWAAFLDRSAVETRAKGAHGATVRVALTKSVAAGGDLAEAIDLADPQAADRVLQLVILQSCRLLGGRPRGDEAQRRGAAPLKLFLSHTKRDAVGLKIAHGLKRYLDTLRVDRFFDEVSIQPGDQLSETLRAEITDAALIAIRTDNYVSSPWCRMELDLAKQSRRPMVIVDALSGQEPRSSPLLVNLPSVRMTDSDVDDVPMLEKITNFIGLEVLRYFYGQTQLELLQERKLVPNDAILLTRPPEVRDFNAVLEAAGGPAVVIYPDPVLTAEESADLAPFAAKFLTPTTLWGRRLDGKRIGLSIGDPDPAELLVLGLSNQHIADAARIIARQVLVAGGRVVYGGTLQDRSLTECVFEMIGAYQRVGAPLQPLLNITPWPWWHDTDAEWRVARRGYLEVVKCPQPRGSETGEIGNCKGGWQLLTQTARGRCDLIRSLTEMRRELAAKTDARVLLGGKQHSFLGLYPGILEEALLSIAQKQPLYVLGGFGGAGNVVAQALMGRRPPELSLDYQRAKSSGYAEAMDVYATICSKRPELGLPAVDYEAAAEGLASYGGRAGTERSQFSLANGLSDAENEVLFSTASLDEACFLIMKGLSQIFA